MNRIRASINASYYVRDISSWVSGENWDVSNWGEEAIFPMKCSILQVYFLLTKLSHLFLRARNDMSLSHISLQLHCIFSSFWSHLFSVLPLLPPVLLAQAGKPDGDPAGTHCCSSCWATCVPGWAAHTAWLCADEAHQEAVWRHLTAHLGPTGARGRPFCWIASKKGIHAAGRGSGEQKHALNNVLSLQAKYVLGEITKSKQNPHKLYCLKRHRFKFPIQWV